MTSSEPQPRSPSGNGGSAPAARPQGDEVPEVLDPLALPDWDATVGGFPDATIFHTQGWARTLHETYRHTLLYPAIRAAGRITAVLPLAEASSWITGRKGVALPFTDYCCPLGTASAAPALFRHMVALGRSRGWKYVEFRGIAPAAVGFDSSLSFFRHDLNLERTEEELFAGLHNSLRRGVRKAESSGLRLQTGASLAEIRDYYELHCRTRQRHGLPPQPFRFFQNLQRNVLAAGHGTVVLGRHNDTLVSGAVFLHFGGNACYKFGASDDRYQHYRGNNLVMWGGIQHCRKAGCRILDFGRTSRDNEGLRRFKLNFGTVEQEVHYVRVGLNRMESLPLSDQSEGPMTHLFRYVPRGLSRYLGSVLYPHIV